MFLSELYHVGTPHVGFTPHSGRYKYGSGENPFQHGASFRSVYADYRKQGFTEKEIAQAMGMSTSELRAKNTIERAEEQAARIARVKRLKEKGYSNTQIGEMVGIPESTVRNYLKEGYADNTKVLNTTVDMLKDELKTKRYLDVGSGVNIGIGISQQKFNAALKQLEEEGYEIHKVDLNQVGTDGGYKTRLKILCPPETTWAEVANNLQDVQTIEHYTNDGGRTILGLEPVKSISSDRIQIRYKEDGGAEKDGVIELRRGVDDISLGKSMYAQVRIGVDGTHYLKGMAMYSDNMPPGVDIIFNTNKTKDKSKMEVLKPMEVNKQTGEIDRDNPFGATIKRQHECINIINEQGVWKGWKKSLASQMLSKQDVKLAKRQLDLDYSRKAAEYEEIMSLTNPTVKKKLLESFADGCDYDAVHLKAAALPRQSSHVILPLNSIKDDEIYAPTFRNGESVVLIRYPHGGIFEIPKLKVNNNNKEGKSLITPASEDAVGINHKVAERLSGADFDGDTVLVIPVNKKVDIKTSPPLKGLENFDPKERYPAYPGMPKMKSDTKQLEMGKVSNLITDMTLKGANESEIARAVRHSMVVIDAEKHHLNYKLSEKENGIKELKIKYQGGANKGASTLISQAKSERRIHQVSIDYKIDPKTGKKIYKETGKTYTDKSGKLIKRTTKTTAMAQAFAEGKDANSLSSGTRMEKEYANYANKMNALGNRARKSMVNTPDFKQSKSAKETYAREVDSLMNKLEIAQRNAPRERQAQIAANIVVRAKRRDNPDMDKDDIKKIQRQALEEARFRMGSASRKDRNIKIEPKEWEAIQAHAIAPTNLKKIIDNTDLDTLRELSTPKKTKTMSPGKVAMIKAMKASGHTLAEIADEIGVSTSTVSNTLKS